MFDDPKKELEKLEKQLLEDEEWFRRELDSAKRMIGQMPEKPKRPTAPRTPQTSKSAAPRTPQASKPATQPAPVRNYANGYGKGEPMARKIQVEEPVEKEKSIKGLLMLAGLETLGILGLAAYWVLVLLR